MNHEEDIVGLIFGMFLGAFISLTITLVGFSNITTKNIDIETGKSFTIGNKKYVATVVSEQLWVDKK